MEREEKRRHARWTRMGKDGHATDLALLTKRGHPVPESLQNKECNFDWYAKSCSGPTHKGVAITPFHHIDYMPVKRAGMPWGAEGAVPLEGLGEEGQEAPVVPRRPLLPVHPQEREDHVCAKKAVLESTTKAKQKTKYF